MSLLQNLHGPQTIAGYDSRLATYGEGPPLVLVPGMDGTGELFYRQIPTLSASHRVATYRLRDDAPEMEMLVEDLARVIEAISPDAEPATVIGESFGGTLAMSLALHHRDRVRELVVLNSFPYFTPQLRLRLALTGLRLLPWGAMGLVRRATAFRLHSRFTHRREILRFLELSRSITKQGYLGRLRILRSYDIRERLSEIGAPTLFLASDRDHLVPAVQQARYMAACVPRATLQVLEGHGHICLIAPNLELAQLLEEWRDARQHAGHGALRPSTPPGSGR
jgi:pimeloyl-ACP methyl ester carboxylesterase